MVTILITNDDGIDAPGIRIAATIAGDWGSTYVFAPMSEQSSMGRSFPRGENIGRYAEFESQLFGPQCRRAVAIEGSPAQVVSYALAEFIEVLPDLCICGINYGENVGSTITGSGTIGSALEVAAYGIPVVAASVAYGGSSGLSPASWQSAGSILGRIVREVLSGGLPPGCALVNVNIPGGAVPTSPMRRTLPSRQPYFVFRKPIRASPDSGCPLPVEIEVDYERLEPWSDIKCIHDGLVSVSLLTDHIGFDGKPDWAGLQRHDT